MHHPDGGDDSTFLKDMIPQILGDCHAKHTKDNIPNILGEIPNEDDMHDIYLSTSYQ